MLLAEGAHINRGLRQVVRDAKRVIRTSAPFALGLSGEGTDLRDLLTLTPEEVTERQRQARRDLEKIRKAAHILQRGGPSAYDRAVAALLPESRDWWMEHVQEGEYPETEKGLAEFVQDHLQPVCIAIESEIRHHQAIKAQALGEGFEADRRETLNRYETHRDRKFQRPLAMLVKLKQLRGG